MRSRGLGVSEVSRAGALLRDILYTAMWGQWPTGWGRGGAESGSMSLATRSLSATDPNKGPGHTGGPQHLKSTWAAKTPCLARTLGTGSHYDIHALCWTCPVTKRKWGRRKSNAVDPWKKRGKNTQAKSWFERLLHNRVESTRRSRVREFVWKCSWRGGLFKTPVYSGKSWLFPHPLATCDLLDPVKHGDITRGSNRKIKAETGSPRRPVVEKKRHPNVDRKIEVPAAAPQFSKWWCSTLLASRDEICLLNIVPQWALLSLGDKGQIQFKWEGDRRGKEGITLCSVVFLAPVRCVGRGTSFLDLRPFSTEERVGKVKDRCGSLLKWFSFSSRNCSSTRLPLNLRAGAYSR